MLKAYARKLLRLVPVYWAIFFLSWGLYPRSTTGGPFWYVSANLFATCKDDWWARLLMIGNLVPQFVSQAPVMGCFFWGWIIDVDLQLTLVCPLLVYAYLTNRKFGHFVIVLFIFLGTFVNMYIANKYDLKVGWLAPQNWQQFTYLIEKPWNHISSMCIGVLFAHVYSDLLNYRRMSDSDEESKRREYPLIHSACNEKNAWFRILIALSGALLWFICFFGSKEVTAEYAAWPQWKNTFFFGWTKSTFALGGFLIVFAVFFSPNSFFLEVMRRPFFRMTGSLCFLGALITPMCMYQILNTTENGNFVRFIWVVWLGSANIIYIIMISLILYLLI